MGVFALKFGYYLSLTHEPKYNTYTWTLDYKYSSDFGTQLLKLCAKFILNFSDDALLLIYPDDTVGHWQVMDHPTKQYVLLL